MAFTKSFHYQEFLYQGWGLIWYESGYSHWQNGDDWERTGGRGGSSHGCSFGGSGGSSLTHVFLDALQGLECIRNYLWKFETDKSLTVV